MNNPRKPAAAQAANADTTIEQAANNGLTKKPYILKRTGGTAQAKHEASRSVIFGAALNDEISTPPLSPDYPINDSVPASPLTSSTLASPLCSGVDGSASSVPLINVSSSASNLTAEGEPAAKKLKRREDLHWCDEKEILNHLHLFDEEQRVWFKRANYKREFFPKGFDEQYFANLTPIIAANYGKARSIVHCGRVAEDGAKFPCDQWSLCSRCASIRGACASEMFAGTFNKGSFFHVTMSFEGSLLFEDSTHKEVLPYWRANEKIIRDLLREGLIDGAYMSHELFLSDILPTRVLPHSHVIVCARQFPYDLAPLIKGVRLKPSIRVLLNEQKSDHESRIRYLTKPIDLTIAYESAWNRYCADDREFAIEINCAMKRFLDNQARAFSALGDRVIYIGNMRSQNKHSFIGVPKKDRLSVKKHLEAKAARKKAKRKGRK